MSFQRKLIIVALASALPWASAQAQSAADLQKEITALKAQLQSLQQKVEAMGTKPADASVEQQVNRLEQKMDLADDAHEASGFKGVKINGVMEAAFKYDSLGKVNDFSASAGYGVGEMGMVQITKETQDGEGVDWTLRLLPGGTPLVHEASISIPLTADSRIIGGLIPDFQGYEFAFPNANSTLGNQLITHNALFDLAGATAYTGVGTSHSFGGGDYTFKWVVGNVDSGNDPTDPAEFTAAAASGTKSVGLAYRGDWFISEYAYLGFSGLHGSVNRNFAIYALDGGYTRGDWQFNGQISMGTQRNAASNGDDAAWTGVSALIGYKLTPRLQLLARADMIENRKNGGGTYVYNGGSTDIGLGAELDETGVAVDPNQGANLMRLSIGTNYQINSNSQWKVEYRMDQSSGYNFLDSDGVTYKRNKSFIGTSIVVSF